MQTADGYIIDKCLNGDSAAFGLLVDKYRAGVYALAYSKLRDFRDAEDVAQEAFVKAYMKLRTLKRFDRFHAWLYAITANLCKDWVRAQSRRPDSEFIEDQDQEALEEPSINSYQEKLVRESIHEALDSLPVNYQQVLTLYYLGGMNSREIAEFLGASPTAIRHRLTRARSQLKEGMVAMMSTTLEEQRLSASFTFRIVEAVKRVKIQPMPRATGVPWGLSLATGIIFTILGLSPYISMLNPVIPSMSSPLPAETKVLKIGEIPVDILKISKISVIAGNKGDGGGAPQNAFMLAPQQDEGGKWTQKADMLTGRRGSAVGVVDGKIYIIGGQGPGGENLAHVEVYDPVADTWSKKSNIPTPRHDLFGGVVNGKIYAIGGGREAGPFFLPTVEVYNPVTDTWKKKADMSTAKICSAVGVVNGKIYVIGGTVDLTWAGISTVEEYNPVTDIWTKKADMPTPRSNISSAASVVDGKIYVIGGTTRNFIPVSTVEVYDPATDTWTKKADMPTPRLGLSTTVMNGKIYAIGGGAPWNPLPTVEVYNPATDTWTKKPDMPTSRGELSACEVGGKIYAIGGTDLGEWFHPLDRGIVEEYDTGLVPEGVEPEGKLPTKWGEIKSD
ncbi:sigma-70 family RNA polymerase sigma factor [Candidatus Poribacteria bacterium]